MATEKEAPANGRAAAKPEATVKAAATSAATSAGTPAGAPAAWGEGLAAYPEWMARYLPAMHDGFNAMNKYVSVPALKAGLGRYMSNPLTGYLMILRTRGRKSGEMRDAPLGYTVVGDAVYCIAGFGPKTHWYQNILADPKVEVILPSRSFSGIAEEVTGEAERLRVLPPLVRSMGVVAGAMVMGNAWKMTPEEISGKCEGLPLVRVRATGIAAGPDDPGGWFWIVPVVVSGWWLVRWMRGRGRARKGERAGR
ncbi:MAG: nitroreductase family deazaflavin-dependent oxidoreductase [Candidatus Limnocylindrales bacterium]|jgi:deazaflavin-dependent oxidoreductase (nitroreductase family)